ncbi:MAG: formate dehydrogenase subunit gamma [Pseudomonadota bacterium]
MSTHISPPAPDGAAPQAGLLPALHRVQADLGHIPDAAVAELARAHNLSRAEVEGVIGFYHDFRRQPAGRHTLRLCRAESCQAMGGDALAEHASRVLGVEFGATTADGAVHLEAVYCLGNCACSPAVMLDGRLLGRVSPASLDALLAEELPR